MAFAEDLAAWYQADEFAQAATVDGVALLGLFDRPAADAALGYAGATATRPTLRVIEAQAPAAPWVGRPVVVAGEGSFVIAEARPNGNGELILELEGA